MSFEHLLAKLLVSVLEALYEEVKVTAMFCWSDSMVTLRGLKRFINGGGVYRFRRE